MTPRPPPGDRAQVLTLEAFVASLVLLLAVAVALQSTAVTPLSSSTANAHVATQQGALARGALDAAAANGSLAATLLYRNATTGAFHASGDDADYESGGPPTAFGALLNRTLAERDLAFNVYLRYANASEGGAIETDCLVCMGTPTATSARAAETVTLYDDQRLRRRDGSPGAVALAGSGLFGGDLDPSSPVYNVVRVEVVAWRA